MNQTHREEEVRQLNPEEEVNGSIPLQKEEHSIKERNGQKKGPSTQNTQLLIR